MLLKAQTHLLVQERSHRRHEIVDAAVKIPRTNRVQKLAVRFTQLA